MNPATALPSASTGLRERISHGKLVRELEQFSLRAATAPDQVHAAEVARARRLAQVAIESGRVAGTPVAAVLQRLPSGMWMALVAIGLLNLFFQPLWTLGIAVLLALWCWTLGRGVQRVSLGEEVLWQVTPVQGVSACEHAVHRAQASPAARAFQAEVLARNEVVCVFHMTAMCELARPARAV